MTADIRTSPEFATDALASVPEPREIPHKTVTPVDADERLTQLAAIYDAYKDAFDAAKEQFEQVQTAIKAELTSMTRQVDQDGQVIRLPFERYELDLPALRQPLTLTFAMRTTLDTKRIRAERPEIADEYSKSSGSWTLGRRR